jgi:hypothetical protein
MNMGIRIIALILLSAVAAHAQGAADPSGHWEGGIDTPEGSIGVVVDLAKNTNGQLAGTIGVPPQNLKGFPLVIESAEGRAITFRFKGAPGNRVFQGVVAEDGASMSGDFTQSGFSMRFALSRKGAAQIDPPVRNAPVTKELEGPWSATLEGTHQNGIKRQVILTLSNQPDGSATGTVFNTGDGLEVPIASIRQDASTLTLDLRSVGGSFSGKVNAEGTEIVGSFIQGTAVLPLTFRRSGVSGDGR